MKSKLSFYVVIVFLFFSTLVEAQWEIVNPQPQNNSLFKAQLVSNTIGWAVGGQGTIIKTTNGGAT